jgi:predicted SnoaL-like aldol condensation-catalyzing enzyme
MAAQTKKQVAIEFLQGAASGNVRDAYARHVAQDFRHHNPSFKGDADSLMVAMEQNAREHPEKRLDVIQALEEGDLVAIYSRVRHEPGEVGHAVFHMFRFEGDRIAELWDVGQEVPQPTVNQYGMF